MLLQDPVLATPSYNLTLPPAPDTGPAMKARTVGLTHTCISTTQLSAQLLADSGH